MSKILAFRSIGSTAPTTSEMTQDGEFAFIDNSAAPKFYIRSNGAVYEVAGASFAKLASPAFTGTPTVPTASANDNSTKIASTAYVDSAISTLDASVSAAITGLDFQADVIDIQTDNTLDPGASPTTGDRYIITNSASLHANFGTISGVGDNDIVSYDGADFVVAYDVSVQGEGALTYDRDSNSSYLYDGSSWSAHVGLSSLVAGNGITKTGNTISVKPDVTTGATVAPLTVGTNGAGVTVDNSTITHSSGTISVNVVDCGTF